MSRSFDATLTCELKRSRTLIAALCIMHAGALAIVWLVPTADGARAVLVPFVLLSAAYTLLRHGRFGLLARHLPNWMRARIVDAIEWDSDDNWSLRDFASGQWHRCELRERLVHPGLVVLRLRPETEPRTRNVVIMADAVAADELRRLRARLRLQTAGA